MSQHIGTNSTTLEGELRECGRELLGQNFGGVFAKGENHPKKKYCVLNTGSRKTGGRHWYAVSPDGSVYDSLKRNGFCNDVEQKDDEKNCGSRAIGWMLLHFANSEIAELV